jgi:hypothetical protein
MTPPTELRRLVYVLLITVTAALTLGRILSAERVYEPSVHRPEGEAGVGVARSAWPRTRPDPWPTFSSNDRSRWAAVRALVEQGTFVIGRRDRGVVLASGPTVLAASNPLEAVILLQAGFAARVGSDTGIVFEDGWQTVDRMLHPDRLEFYSTKPPLLTLLAAAEYAGLRKVLGWSIVDNRWQVIPTILITFNVVPLLLYLWLLTRLLERWGGTDWGRFYVLATACFGTLVTPFLLSLNNHTLATATTLLALYAVVRCRESTRGGAGWFLLAGASAGFTACNELPALALAAGMFVYLLWNRPGPTLAWFLPAALAIPALLLLGFFSLPSDQRPMPSPSYPLTGAYAEFGGPWYEYEGSHWRKVPGQVKSGIDWAGRSESKFAYAFHLLLGHHGIFSLTPFTILALIGAVAGSWHLLRAASPGERGGVSPVAEVVRLQLQAPPLKSHDFSYGLLPPRSSDGVGELDRVAALTLLLSLTVVAFYVVKSDNYGGWSNGPRWLMWLTPLWLLSLLPVADRLAGSVRGRALGLLLLALSVVSMSYQLWNPWRHPWLYVMMESRGWIRY